MLQKVSSWKEDERMWTFVLFPYFLHISLLTMNQKWIIVSSFCADSSTYLGQLMQVELTHLKDLIAFFQKVV